MHIDLFYLFFFFNDTATTEIYTLSLHDALPIWRARAAHARPGGRAPTPPRGRGRGGRVRRRARGALLRAPRAQDRKSTRLNSSHANISYAVFCLKKKNKQKNVHISFKIDIYASL